jgi:DNA-binding response OmpR family regulator
VIAFPSTFPDDAFNSFRMLNVLRPDPTVLVVDDEESIHRLFAEVLKQAGYTALHAYTVAETKLRLRETPLVDAVILDLTLRDGESGLTILTWLRTQTAYAKLPVLILTGSTPLSEDAEATIRRDRAYVFYKGLRMLEIVEHLAAILGKRRPDQ